MPKGKRYEVLVQIGHLKRRARDQEEQATGIVDGREGFAPSLLVGCPYILPASLEEPQVLHDRVVVRWRKRAAAIQRPLSHRDARRGVFAPGSKLRPLVVGAGAPAATACPKANEAKANVAESRPPQQATRDGTSHIDWASLLKL